jgi:tetratricopeptide (TPR) repeat protein
MDAFEKAIELGEYRMVIRLLSYYGRTNESILGIERCKEISNRVTDLVYQSIISNEEKGIPQTLSAFLITKLSVVHSTGIGLYHVSTNETRSLALNKIGVKLGSVEALYNLGMHYFNGQGTERNYDLAFKYFLESAEKGDKDAQREVAIFYNLGLLTNTKDYAKAKEWFQKAAEQYDYESCVTLLRWSSDSIIPQNDDLRDPKTQSELLLKIVESLKRKIWPNQKKQPTTLSIPVTLLQYWSDLITDEIPKLNRKIIELECRPPTEGGSLYKMAAKEFEHFTNL